MFIAALFIIVKYWRQLKYATSERINSCIHSMKYYSSKKKGREGGRKGGREEGREGGRKEGRKEGREGRREGGRKGEKRERNEHMIWVNFLVIMLSKRS